MQSAGSPGRRPRRRLPRCAGLDHNPLRRPSDRLEARVGLLLVVVFLLAGPLVAGWAADAAYHSSARVEQVERSDRLPTKAILLADAGPVVVGFTVVPQVPVPARWTAADGSVRTGVVVVPVTASAGEVVQIWTDRAGNVVDAPRHHDQTVVRALVAAVLAGLALAALLAGVRVAVRRALDRRRLAGWEAEWSQVAPRWTDHR